MQAGHGSKATRLGAAVVALCCAGLLFASPASAAYEETGIFAGSSTPLSEEQLQANEEIQLGGASGMAVNYTGAGGVAKGTVYAVTRLLNTSAVVMYVPKAGGGLEFAERWELNGAGGPYQRCGPALGTSCAANVRASTGGVDVDVDETTGNVYAFNGEGGRVVEYSADGSEVIAGFGEKAAGGKTVPETPAQTHGSPYPGGLAVNEEGWVYLYDLGQNESAAAYHRLMVFKPQSPGDYEHYEYAGEIAGRTTSEGEAPQMPVTDAAGNVYTAPVEGKFIQEFAPEAPGAYPHHSTPTCSFEFTHGGAAGGIDSIAVNPLSGEPFFYSEKKETKVKWVRQLGPCEAGKFTEVAKAQVLPERSDLWAMAVDPADRFQPSRPKGILYGGAFGPVPERRRHRRTGPVLLGYIFAPPKGPAKALTVAKSGSGTGTVTSEPTGIECGSLCAEEFEEGSTVVLTATPESGSEFVEWTGACSGTILPVCEVTIEAATDVGASFAPNSVSGPPLTLNIEEGSGTVVSNPAGIECTGSAPHECTTEEIAEGETVTLTASPAAGYQFKSWKYCDSGGVHGRQCTITLTENHKPVGAKFAAANDVTVEKTGNGTGSITGVTCGNTCTAATGSIVASKTVTLKAKPYAKNSEFLGWSASPVSCTLSEEGKTCSLGILAANETVEAEFAEIARENLTLTKSGSGSGSVKSAPAGINCSYTCGSNTAYFYKGTSVTLTAAVQVGKGSALGNWGGACSGSRGDPLRGLYERSQVGHGGIQLTAEATTGSTQRRLALLALPAALLCLASLFFLGLLASPSAEAAQMEQVCTFAGSAAPETAEEIAEDEEVQLGGVGGMAVNYTGAGGVPAGTVYAVRKISEWMCAWRCSRLEAEEGARSSVSPGKLRSKKKPMNAAGRYWAWKAKKSNSPASHGRSPGRQRSTSMSIRRPATSMCSPMKSQTPGWDVGDSRVQCRRLRRNHALRGKGGERENDGGNVDADPRITLPGRLGGERSGGSLRLRPQRPPADNFYHRLMVFRPQSPGDFEHYAYAGEVAAGFGGAGKIPANPVTDAAGNVYVAGAGEDYIEEYAPETPSTYPGSPAKAICSFEFPKGGITAITVNPESGEVFFFSYKKEAGFSFKLVHQLSACDEATGEFKEIGRFEVSPQRDDLYGLAFDPVRGFIPATPPGAPARPAGMLYGGAPRPVPDVGKGEPGQSSLGYGFAPAEENPPVVVSEAVSKVSAKSAQLHAAIEPRGFQTTYTFQYITEAAFEAEGESFEKATEAPPGGAPLGGTGGPRAPRRASAAWRRIANTATGSSHAATARRAKRANSVRPTARRCAFAPIPSKPGRCPTAAPGSWSPRRRRTAGRSSRRTRGSTAAESSNASPGTQATRPSRFRAPPTGKRSPMREPLSNSGKGQRWKTSTSPAAPRAAGRAPT